MLDKYILNENGEPVIEHDILKWAAWLEPALSAGGTGVILQEIDDVKVSTIFLSIDNNFFGTPPILWETMVFGGPLEGRMDRCSGSREQAMAMHARMVARVKAAKIPENKIKV